MRLRASILLLLLLVLPLASATSHYSFEHAEELKPLINWNDYSPGAFEKAVRENKPVFLLLTAPSWCYWCQVYESEEYLFHPDVIKEINENFVPIYVDADKRQDLTRQYLEGGWPSTTIMTPSRERIYGFSGVRPVQNMIVNLQQAANYVDTQGFSNTVNYDYQKTPQIIPSESQLQSLINSYALFILQAHDSQFGGFGTGQKFPQGRALDFSLEIYENTGDKQYLNLVEKTLENQYTSISELENNYNLFDPVEGGFHRYGTRRDWTPPHYEKMLYDNAKLLKAYYHLSLVSENAIVDDVVLKTDNYIQERWYDSRNGGFYGNTDVHGEDEYYGENPRPSEKPRVEKTKYTDWNSEAIFTYLYLWGESGNEKYKSMSEKSLDFYSTEMIGEEGAYHYLKEDGEKGVRGNLLDNSYLLLAFVSGHEVLKEEKFLESARNIADYSLDNLYDWNSGGFFERNSPDKEMYAVGDNINLGKPGEENGIMAYAMLKLYSQTGDARYLNAGLKTLGTMSSKSGGLDSGYYYAKTAQYVLENNLLDDYEKNKENIAEIENGELVEFWVDELVAKKISTGETNKFVVSDFGLDKLGGPLVLLLIVALIAGLVSFASPCTLPILPAYVAYTLRTDKKNIKGMTFSFFLGLIVIFVLLGMGATFIGGFLKSQIETFSQVAGVAISLFGFFIIFGKSLRGIKIKHRKPASYFGSFLFGGILGLSWTPCVGPILVAILLLASTTGSAFSGGLMLFFYGLGLAVPLFIVSYYFGKAKREGKIWRFIGGKELHFRFGSEIYSIHTTALISGLLFLMLGYLIFSGQLIIFNQYVTATGFQKWIFGLEEKLLGWVR